MFKFKIFEFKYLISNYPKFCSFFFLYYGRLFVFIVAQWNRSKLTKFYITFICTSRFVLFESNDFFRLSFRICLVA